MKRIILCLLVCLSLYGCSENKMTKDLEESSLEEGKTDEFQEASMEKMEKERVFLPQNISEMIVSQEWSDERIQNNLFAAVGEKMYFSRKAQDDTKAKIYQMKMEQDILMETDIEIPEEMSVSAMASDGYGKLYIFLRGDNISMIKIVDADDNEVNEVDVTEALGTEISMCQSLAVDSYGNFYITGLWATMGISAEGEKLWLVKNSDIGLGDTFTSIVGWDDMLYIPYDKENDMWIGKINTQDGSIIKEYLLDDMSYEDKILAMGLGNEEEILLYSSVSGVWKWAENNSLLEEIKEISEKNLAYNENIIIRSFLPDGRLLIVKNVDENKRIYQYIPLF